MSESQEECKRIAWRREIFIVSNETHVLEYLRLSNRVAFTTRSATHPITFTEPKLESTELELIGPQHFVVCIPVIKKPTEYDMIVDQLFETQNCFGFNCGKGEVLTPFHISLYPNEEAMYSAIEQQVVESIGKIFS